MTFLADACALIFFHGRGGESMTAPAVQAMEEGDILVSPITVWEITRKTILGKLQSPKPKHHAGDFSSWLIDAGYRILPLSWAACERANGLPAFHSDPMDRMLIATALENALTIITKDKIFARYGVPTIW